LKFEIPKIYPITDVGLSGISHTEQARRFIDGGAKIVQFREKHAAPLDWYDDVCEAINLCRQNKVISIINDRIDIAMAASADGVHLGQTDLPPSAARRILGDMAIIGYSTHTIEQVTKAIKLDVDYIALGPVFPTKTKQNPDSVVGLELIRQVRAITRGMPLVAIGGIDLANAGSVFDAGSDSIALISALVGDAPKIAQQTNALITQFV